MKHVKNSTCVSLLVLLSRYYILDLVVASLASKNTVRSKKKIFWYLFGMNKSASVTWGVIFFDGNLAFVRCHDQLAMFILENVKTIFSDATQSAFTFSKLAIETLQQCVKYVQS